MLGKIHQGLLAIISFILLNACRASALQTSITESDAVGRRVLSAPQAYQPQSVGEVVPASMEATRALAWRIFAEVAQPVSFSTSMKDGRSVPVVVPRFLTWMTAEDMQRWFREAVRAAPLAQVQTGEPLQDAQMRAADEWWLHELDTMPAPLQNRLQIWFDQHPDPTLADWSGIGGTSRIYYSPGLMHSILQNYAELGHCFKGLARPDALNAAAPCLSHDLPPSAAIVKAAWSNARAKFKSYATDATTLRNLMNDPASSWSSIGEETKVPDTLLTVNVGQERLLLPGFHIMTKDQKDWFWLTAWWSAEADTDFGADRPDFVKALGPQLAHYKICAVTSFRDEAEDLDALGLKYPDLIAAFRAAQTGNGGASWCSNPYIEAGVANQRSNCIGCHQFAGTDARQENIVRETQKVRDTFVTDYVWSAALGGQSLFNILDSNLSWRETQPGD